MTDPDVPRTGRIRRPPSPFRTVTVIATAALGPRLRRVTLAGDALVGFPVPLPGASVRMLVTTPGSPELVLPAWTGNEFLLPDGSRPPIRTFTPRRVDPDAGELDVDVVLHGGGVASEWARVAAPGAVATISDPGSAGSARSCQVTVAPGCPGSGLRPSGAATSTWTATVASCGSTSSSCAIAGSADSSPARRNADASGSTA